MSSYEDPFPSDHFELESLRSAQSSSLTEPLQVPDCTVEMALVALGLSRPEELFLLLGQTELARRLRLSERQLSTLLAESSKLILSKISQGTALEMSQEGLEISAASASTTRWTAYGRRLSLGDPVLDRWVSSTLSLCLSVSTVQ